MENKAMQLIDAGGHFDANGLDNFLGDLGGVSYAVVAIMGPHSSGKSTLLNRLFYTNFKEMDADSGRFPTTHGVWMERSACTEPCTEPCTIVIDLQGSNREEDVTEFEQQSALFALAVSDIVLINMWYHDIGYRQTAHKLLLKTVFETMFKCKPLATTPRLRTLYFVLRDKAKTPLEKVKPVLMEDIQKFRLPGSILMRKKRKIKDYVI